MVLRCVRENAGMVVVARGVGGRYVRGSFWGGWDGVGEKMGGRGDGALGRKGV